MAMVEGRVHWERSNAKRALLPLVLSAILHVLLLQYASQQAEWFAKAPPARPPVEIVDEKDLVGIDSKAKQIVESEDAHNRALDPDAKYLGKHNQRVEKQTRARIIDDFRESQSKGAPSAGSKSEGKPAEQHAEDSTQRERRLAPVEEGVPSQSRDWRTLSMRDLSLGGEGGVSGATDDWVEGVAEGDRTLLSTREYRFFSYYQRIKELLRQQWKPRVERKMLSLWGRGKSLKEEELITRVLVTLDDGGKIRKIARIASSGVVELDEAAIESFEQAAPFPNPPKGIIEPDGLVRIRWDFILKTESAPRIQFQRVGHPNF
jgi:protein TonB